MELVLQVGSVFGDCELNIHKTELGLYVVESVFEGNKTLDCEFMLSDLEELANKLAVLILAAKKENI